MKTIKEIKWEEYIILSNKKRAIAEFMGVEVTQPYEQNNDELQDGLLYYFGTNSIIPRTAIHRYYPSSGIDYDKSWDWIIPVLNKIYKKTNIHVIEVFEAILRKDITGVFNWAAETIKQQNNENKD